MELQRAKRLIRKQMNLHGCKKYKYKICDELNNGLLAGWLAWNKTIIFRKSFVEAATEQELRVATLHEIAHAVCGATIMPSGRTIHHSKAWKRRLMFWGIPERLCRRKLVGFGQSRLFKNH